MGVTRQVTWVTLWRAKRKHRKAAGSPNTGGIRAIDERSFRPVTGFGWATIQAEGVLARSEAQRLRRQNAVNVAWRGT
jgi:hypothetical protein